MVTILQKARDVYVNRPTVGLWILYGIYPKKGTPFLFIFHFPILFVQLYLLTSEHSLLKQ